MCYHEEKLVLSIASIYLFNYRWAGLLDGRFEQDELSALVLQDEQFHEVRKRVSETDALLIDEISMVSSRILSQLELVCRTVRNNNVTFGGIQIIMCGDFYQLPPVKDSQDKGLFAFQSPFWTSYMTHRIQLTQVRRQTDAALIRAIDETARGAVSKETEMFLNSLDTETETPDAVHLFPKNYDVQLHNSKRLRDMPDDEDNPIITYRATAQSGSLKHL
jgi:ATP-dependent DNA helicase PIF1